MSSLAATNKLNSVLQDKLNSKANTMNRLNVSRQQSSCGTSREPTVVSPRKDIVKTVDQEDDVICEEDHDRN